MWECDDGWYIRNTSETIGCNQRRILGGFDIEKLDRNEIKSRWWRTKEIRIIN